MKRVIYKGVIGTVLSEGRSCYMVALPYGVKFVDKSQTNETHPAPASIRKRKPRLTVVKPLN